MAITIPTRPALRIGAPTPLDLARFQKSAPAQPLPEFATALSLDVSGTTNQASTMVDAIAGDAATQARFAEVREERAAESAAKEAARLQALVDQFLEGARERFDAEKLAAERYAYAQNEANRQAQGYRDSLAYTVTPYADETVVIQDALLPERFAHAGQNEDLSALSPEFDAWLDDLERRGSTVARPFRELQQARKDANFIREDIKSLDAGKGAYTWGGLDGDLGKDLQAGWVVWRKTHPAQTSTGAAPAKPRVPWLWILLTLFGGF